MQNLTQQKYFKYRDVFFKNVTHSPIVAKIKKYEALSTGAFTDFTGDSDRTFKSLEVKVLLDREITEFKRSKYGIEHDVSGVLYVSPMHLERVRPDFQSWLDNFQKLRVEVFGDEYQVSMIRYKEPLYNTYICAELHLKDLHKGVE